MADPKCVFDAFEREGPQAYAKNEQDDKISLPERTLA